jgi:hypothetical protein
MALTLSFSVELTALQTTWSASIAAKSVTWVTRAENLDQGFILLFI